MLPPENQEPGSTRQSGKKARPRPERRRVTNQMIAKQMTWSGRVSGTGNMLRDEVPDAKVGSLYLCIQPSNAKSWAIRYRWRGKNTKHTLGDFDKLDVSGARKLAKKAFQDVQSGVSPHHAKVEARRAPAEARKPEAQKVSAVVSKWLDALETKGVRERSIDEYRRMLKRDVLPEWGDRQIGDLSRADIHEMLDKVAKRGPVMANRLFQCLRGLARYGVSRQIITTSPLSGMEAPSREESRKRVLSDDELEAVWHAADAQGYPAGPLFKLLILLGARRREVERMQWQEVDTKKREWTLPAERSKNREDRVTPLSDAAIAVLSGMPRIDDCPFVFTSDGKHAFAGTQGVRERIAKAAKVSDWTTHDLRRTLGTGLHRLGVSPIHVEAALGHAVLQGVAKTYGRYSFAKEKREALDLWSKHVTTLVGKPRTKPGKTVRTRVQEPRSKAKPKRAR